MDHSLMPVSRARPEKLCDNFESRASQVVLHKHKKILR